MVLRHPTLDCEGNCTPCYPNFSPFPGKGRCWNHMMDMNSLECVASTSPTLLTEHKHQLVLCRSLDCNHVHSDSASRLSPCLGLHILVWEERNLGSMLNTLCVTANKGHSERWTNIPPKDKPTAVLVIYTLGINNSTKDKKVRSQACPLFGGSPESLCYFCSLFLRCCFSANGKLLWKHSTPTSCSLQQR